jgi:glycosyltransferase involved in cell wall biosynthesis
VSTLSELPRDLPPVNPEAQPEGLRVAFFSDAFPERNGTGAYYHDLLAQLSERVRAVQIFQPRNEGRRPLLSIPMPGDPGQRLVTPHLKSVRTACDALEPTVIVVVTPGLYGLLGVWEARRRGAALVAAFHTDFEQLARMYWNPLSRFFVNLVLRSANRIICRASRTVLINNAGLRDDVLRLGARDVEVIGTPLDSDFLRRPLKPIAPVLRRVCFAGRLAPEKNVEKVIEAARQQPDIEVLIAGDGPLRHKLEELARDCPNVRFLGWLARTELIDAIDSASLLLLPSAFETFGSVALEAMARGRPALVSTRAGIHAWPALRKGLFALENPTDLADVLGELRALSPDAWRDRAAAAREVAESLNAATLDHWTSLLTRHQQGLPPPPETDE